MRAIEFNSNKDRFLISIDKSFIDQKVLYGLLDNMRLELLAKKINFSKSVEEIGDEIKADWWKKNKKKFLSGNL